MIIKLCHFLFSSFEHKPLKAHNLPIRGPTKMTVKQ